MQNCVITTCSSVVLGALFAVPTAFADWTWNSTAKTLTDENGIVLQYVTRENSTGLLIVGDDMHSAVKTLNGQTTLDLSKPVVGAPGIGYLGAAAFQNQTTLTKIVFPSSLKQTKANSCRGCSGLTEIDLSACANLTSLGSCMVMGTKVGEIRLPDSVVTIGNNFAESLTSLTNVTPKVMPNLTTIGGSSFKGTKLAGDYVFPKVTSINNRAFLSSKITSVDLSASTLTAIGDEAFSSCTSLTNAVLPSSVTTIGTQAFFGCTALAHPTPFVPRNVKSVGSDAFQNAAIGGDLILTNQIVKFVKSNNFRATKITSLDLSASTNNVSLPQYAFYDCKKLKKIRFGSGLIECASQVFNNAPLEEVRFAGPPPTTLTFEGFYYGSWTSLSTKIYAPKGDPDWRLFLTTNSNSRVSWVTTALTQTEKDAFATKWPDERVPTRKVCMKNGGTICYQYLCWWWPKGNPGFSIIVR